MRNLKNRFVLVAAASATGLSLLACFTEPASAKGNGKFLGIFGKREMVLKVKYRGDNIGGITIEPRKTEADSDQRNPNNDNSKESDDAEDSADPGDDPSGSDPGLPENSPRN